MAARHAVLIFMVPLPPYANLVREHAPNARILFDRFHIVKHLNEAVDATRRELWRQLTTKERVPLKGTRWLLLKNPPLISRYGKRNDRGTLHTV